MDFSYIDSERIILEIESRPCLYDSKCETYKDRTVKMDSWLSVAKNVVGEKWNDMTNEDKNACGKEIQKRWKSLKDSFARALKNQEGRSGSGATKCKPYVYYKQMSFLTRTLQPRPTSGTMDVEESHPSPDMDGSGHRTEDEQGNVQEIGPTVSRPTNSHQRKRGANSFERELIDVLQSNKISRNISEELERDPDRMFLLSLLPSMQAVKPEYKLDMQIRMLGVMKSFSSARTLGFYPQAPSSYSAPPSFVPCTQDTSLQSPTSVASHESDESIMSLFKLP